MRFFDREIIEAAKSDKYFDKINAEEISEYYNISIAIVKEEIVFVRKNLNKIDPEEI